MSPTYSIKLQPDDNGTLLVTCPALPDPPTKIFERQLLIDLLNQDQFLIVALVLNGHASDERPGTSEKLSGLK